MSGIIWRGGLWTTRPTVHQERDTHAETLRVLLLREAGRRSGTALTMRYHADHETPSGVAMRVSQGEEHAYAGIALILALMIGGE